MDKARKGYEWWDKLNAVQRYSFFIGADGGVRRVENISGNWIDVSEAQAVVDDAQDEINQLRERLARLVPAEAPAPQLPSASGEREAFDKWWTHQHQTAANRRDGDDYLTIEDDKGNYLSAFKAGAAHGRAALAPSPGIDAAGQKPVAYLIDWPDEPDLGHYFSEAPTDTGRCRALVLADAAPPAAQPSERTLQEQIQGAKAEVATWERDRRDAVVLQGPLDPHPPSRACMCDACKPSFDNGADDPTQRHDIVQHVPATSAAWLAEAQRLVTDVEDSAYRFGHASIEKAALFAHLRTHPNQGGANG
jgi:hypothetical protein